MRELDPDIRAVLATLAVLPERKRVATVKAKQRKRAEERLSTQLELLADELEAVIPKSHPLFDVVLMQVAIRKAVQAQEEPEYVSCLEFPQGW